MQIGVNSKFVAYTFQKATVDHFVGSEFKVCTSGDMKFVPLK